MEAIGLTIGIASLFSTCIDCFEIFQAVKDYDEYVDIILVKLDLEKTRLLIWGDGVGIMKRAGDGRAPELDDDSKAPTVQRCLERIKSLLSTFDTFQAEYGLRRSDPTLTQKSAVAQLLSSSSLAMFKLTARRFWVRNKASPSSILPKIKWAIHEKEKFEGLINHLKDFIDGLNEIVPIQREMQDQIIQEDISAIIDVSQLRLIEAACEGSYRTWSEKASQIIHDSEVGTLDRRTVEEYIRDQDDISIPVTTSKERKIAEALSKPGMPSWTQEESKLRLQNSSSVYFVATPSCESHLETQNDICANWTRNPRFPYEDVDFCAACALQEYKPGGRIASTIDLRRVNPAFRPLSITRGSEAFLDDALPVGKLYIHCAPCKCQIATALSIASGARPLSFSRALLPYVRVDYRIPSSCLSYQQLERMKYLQSEIKRFDTLCGRNYYATTNYIDRMWLDQMVMELEDEVTVRSQGQPVAQEILSEYVDRRQPDKRCCGVVLVGEVDHIQSFMQSSLFPQSARMPRETEIWEMNYADYKNWRRVPLGSFTPRDFQ